MGLFKPAWMSRNHSKAWDAAEKVSDSAELERIMNEAPSDNARRAALRKITDQSVLARAAKNDESKFVREAARERLMSIQEDERVADEIKRKEQIERINDQNELAEIAINSKANRVRLAAVEKLTDSLLLADIVRKCWHENLDAEIRAAVIMRIKDQAVLAELALDYCKDNAVYVYNEIVEAISEQPILEQIVRNGEFCIEDRLIALEMITDSAILENLSNTLPDEMYKRRNNSSDIDLRKRVAERLQTQKCEALCNGQHIWEFVEETSEECGDHTYFTNHYRCKKCGLEKTADGGSRW